MRLPSRAALGEAFRDIVPPSGSALGGITVRQLDEEVPAGLEARARANAGSTEAEITTILTEAVQPPSGSRRSLAFLVGAGQGSMTMGEIVQHVRELRGDD